MKKIILKPHHFILAFTLVIGSLFIIGCQSEDIANDDDTKIESSTSKSIPVPSIPYIPDFTPPNVPNQFIDDHCVVRLAYLSYLERCPENAGVVGYWINVRQTQGFEGLAAGFITSPEASQRWNSRYHAYLNRNNLTSHQLNKKIYIAYRGLLLREPDVAGGLYWDGILDQRGIIEVAKGIGNSPEFRNRQLGFPTECSNAANQCTF